MKPVKLSNHAIGKRQPKVSQKTKNVMLKGQGANIAEQDRGSWQSSATTTSNPYYNNNFFYRWQEFTRWYFTSWEARKIVDIPVDDAFRKPFKLTGIPDTDASLLLKEYERLEMDNRMQRACKQERLLGGCALLFILNGDEDEAKRNQSQFFGKPIDLKTIQHGDLQKVNLVDINQITRPNDEYSVFSPEYDDPDKYQIMEIVCHRSRLMLFRGEPLYGRNNQTLLMNFRLNPQGFGESVLTPIYDTLIRAAGTQEGAYHLVNLSSCLLATVENLKELSTTNPTAITKIQSLMEQISIYRAAILDGKTAKIEQHSASFGSVPELVMSFLQILAAASDIPATRYLGTAPGGLNATGKADLENYYNVIDSYQRTRIKPKLMQFFEIAACNLWGYAKWESMKQDFGIEFPPLWNLDEVEQANMVKTIVDTYMPIWESGLIDTAGLQKELAMRGVFMSDVELQEVIDDMTEPPVDSDSVLKELKSVAK